MRVLEFEGFDRRQMTKMVTSHLRQAFINQTVVLAVIVSAVYAVALKYLCAYYRALETAREIIDEIDRRMLNARSRPETLYTSTELPEKSMPKEHDHESRNVKDADEDDDESLIAGYRETAEERKPPAPVTEDESLIAGHEEAAVERGPPAPVTESSLTGRTSDAEPDDESLTGYREENSNNEPKKEDDDSSALKPAIRIDDGGKISDDEEERPTSYVALPNYQKSIKLNVSMLIYCIRAGYARLIAITLILLSTDGEFIDKELVRAQAPFLLNLMAVLAANVFKVDYRSVMQAKGSGGEVSARDYLRISDINKFLDSSHFKLNVVDVVKGKGSNFASFFTKKFTDFYKPVNAILKPTLISGDVEKLDSALLNLSTSGYERLNHDLTNWYHYKLIPFFQRNAGLKMQLVQKFETLLEVSPNVNSRNTPLMSNFVIIYQDPPKRAGAAEEEPSKVRQECVTYIEQKIRVNNKRGPARGTDSDFRSDYVLGILLIRKAIEMVRSKSYQ